MIACLEQVCEKMQTGAKRKSSFVIELTRDYSEKVFSDIYPSKVDMRGKSKLKQLVAEHMLTVVSTDVSVRFESRCAKLCRSVGDRFPLTPEFFNQCFFCFDVDEFDVDVSWFWNMFVTNTSKPTFTTRVLMTSATVGIVWSFFWLLKQNWTIPCDETNQHHAVGWTKYFIINDSKAITCCVHTFNGQIILVCLKQTFHLLFQTYCRFIVKKNLWNTGMCIVYTLDQFTLYLCHVEKMSDGSSRLRNDLVFNTRCVKLQQFECLLTFYFRTFFLVDFRNGLVCHCPKNERHRFIFHHDLQMCMFRPEYIADDTIIHTHDDGDKDECEEHKKRDNMSCLIWLTYISK